MHFATRYGNKALDHRFRTALAAARCWRDAERQARQKGLYFREVQCRTGVERCLKEARGIRAQMRAELGGVDLDWLRERMATEQPPSVFAAFATTRAAQP